eukprot:TRINITY_DN14376_c0_g1_i1.p1 TRINITY_DN14376_c0_g1~~TRINITY_DN14376_c0_g1_i1.p1  ORF type:complete len:903 (-),score=142.13 TRINITY_DN14376_c0_g1_i1:9-2717(-)
MKKGADALDPQIMGSKLAKSMPKIVSDVLSSLPALTATRSNATLDPADLDMASVNKAINKLNTMIAEAQVRLDMKDIECKEFKEQSDKTRNQVRNDLSRLATTIGALKESEISSNSQIMLTTTGIESAKEEHRNEKKTFEAKLIADREQLAEHKRDLQVTVFMLELSKCKDKQSFTQISAAGASTQIEACEDANGTSEYSFQDSHLEQYKNSLSPKGRELLGFALGRSEAMASGGGDAALRAAAMAFGGGFDLEDGDENDDAQRPLVGLAAMDVNQKPGAKTAKTPQNSEKQGKRCAQAKPNCGVLHDTFAALWGEMKDMVEDLSKVIADDTKAWNDFDDRLNAEIQGLTTEKGDLGKTLAQTQSANAAETEMQGQKLEEQTELNSIHDKTMKECKATMREILYTEICGTISVRNELLGATKKIPDSEIVDCSFTEWSPGECTVPCDDTMVGGVETLTREVITKNKNYGAACPALNMTKKCGQYKCPVDCKLSDWEEYSKCTKECGGGVQTRSRQLLVKPKNGGKACDTLQDTRACNTGTCDRNCDLSEWTPFTPCSKACASGVTTRVKSITRPKRARGVCWAEKDPLRFQEESCNTQDCVGDEICIAKTDIVIALDGSGSMTKKGFEVIKKLALEIVARVRHEAYGLQAVRVGIVQFGNGHLSDDGVVSDAYLALPLDNDLAKVSKAITDLTWQRGFTNMAQGIMKSADVLKRSMRKNAFGQAIIITDGKPSFKSATRIAVHKLREASSLMIVQVKSFPTKTDQKLMQEYASDPKAVNYVLVPGKKALKRDYAKYASQVVVNMCPRAESPSTVQKLITENGFKLIRDEAFCSSSPSMTTTAPSAEKCVDAAGAGLTKWVQFAFSPLANPALGGQCMFFAEQCKTWTKAIGYKTYEKVDPKL